MIVTISATPGQSPTCPLVARSVTPILEHLVPAGARTQDRMKAGLEHLTRNVSPIQDRRGIVYRLVSRGRIFVLWKLVSLLTSRRCCVITQRLAPSSPCHQGFNCLVGRSPRSFTFWPNIAPIGLQIASGLLTDVGVALTLKPYLTTVLPPGLSVLKHKRCIW